MLRLVSYSAYTSTSSRQFHTNRAAEMQTSNIDRRVSHVLVFLDVSGLVRAAGPRFLGSRENAKPSRCLGVFGLSLHTQERDLYDIFSRYGPIDDLQLVYDNYTGRSRGFGFVYFNHVADAKAAKADAHGMEVDGRPIRCDFSITDRPHSPTPGIYMGRPTRRSAPRRRSISRGRYSRSRSRSRSYDRK
ncbi:hypothetical protein P879_05520 [Paragonimus westermani]|uniref:RRM domain-containing protein n=1 Tax=Paragonimus westermani TaxID=34504 RepID=A0A8T0DID5_9TREM|nr:hypothetical protein P879_05520 [Paragonimus westermani]